MAVVVRAVPAALFFGTGDVISWRLLAQLLLNGENFYHSRDDLVLHNWPPLWIYLLAGLWRAHDASGLPFSFLVKLPATGADA
jgi:hypothetical protein